MTRDDPVQHNLALIARLLEAAGYAIEVDYAAASIIVWLENWPLHLAVRSRGRDDEPTRR